MRVIYTIILSVLLGFLAPALLPEKAYAQGDMVSVQVFYDQLSPYGTWVSDPTYGYVWIPNVGAHFSPYRTNGYWVWTDYGWTWVSNYAWGWAPFHYGRWNYTADYGWAWIPDTEWGPAWVTWRTAPGYYGWAPLGPGITVDYAVGPAYSVPARRWVFVEDRYFGRPDIYRYYGPRKNNSTIIVRSSIVNYTYHDNSRRITYISGPRREDVQRSTGRTFTRVVIRDNAHPGQSVAHNQLSIYRPRIGSAGGARPAPRTVTDIKNVPSRRRNTATQPANNNTPRNPGGGVINQQNNHSNFQPGNMQGGRSTAPATNPPATNTHPGNAGRDPGNASWNRNPPPQQNAPRVQPQQSIPRTPPQQNIQRTQPQPQRWPQQQRPNMQQTQPAQQPSARPAPQQRPVQQQPQPRTVPQQNVPRSAPQLGPGGMRPAQRMPQQDPHQPTPGRR